MNRIDTWIRRRLKSHPLRAKSLIITIYGDSIAPHGGAASLRSLIKLVEPFDFTSRLVRTVAYRLTQDDWLQAERIGRVSVYRLTSSGRRWGEHCRAYAIPPATWDATWLLVLHLPGAGVEERNALKKQLQWEGFGIVAPGVLARPGGDANAVNEILRKSGLANKATVLQARNLNGVTTQPLRDLAHACWRLDDLAQFYRRFIRRYEPLLLALRRDSVDPQRCFVIRTLLIHDFRRVVVRDPQLPEALLPTDWPGAAARELSRALYWLVLDSSERYLDATLETAQGPLPSAAPHLFERFGGLTRLSDTQSLTGTRG
jgi:phenylacetic acid degradation operon negative regulatory protein